MHTTEFAKPYAITIQTMGHDVETIKDVVGSRTAEGWKFVEDQTLDMVQMVSPIVAGRQEMEYIRNMTRRMVESGIKVVFIHLTTAEMKVSVPVKTRRMQ